MSKLLQYLQEKVVFLPIKLPDDHTFNLDCTFKEYHFETPADGKINALHLSCKDAKGVILYFHGNAGNLERWGKIAAEFLRFGYDILIPDYRNYGKSSGPRNEKFLFGDAQFCYDFLREKYAEDHIIVYGRSLGGAFATKIAADNEPKLLILEATFFNLQDMANRWLPSKATDRISPSMTYHFLSNESILHVNCPVFHFHGDKDIVVPLKSGEKLFNTLQTEKPGLKKKFIKISGGNHDNLSHFPDYWEELEKILR